MALLSMTGFGRATVQSELGTFGVEIRSVNNRFFDFTARLPREWSVIESRLRERIHERVQRGKVDVWIQWVPASGLTPTVELGEEMIGEIVRRFREAGKRVGESIEIPWGDFFKVPGVLTIRPPEIDSDALFAAIEPPLDQAIEQLNAMREAEGKAMTAALANHLAAMQKNTDDIEEIRGCVLERQRERLQRLVEQMNATVAQAVSSERIEAEILLFADRADITEEIVRLRSHYDAFKTLLVSKDSEPAGKRLDFLTQEILRETNTIGSKAKDTQISAAVVALKHETEKVREQIQNCE